MLVLLLLNNIKPQKQTFFQKVNKTKVDESYIDVIDVLEQLLFIF